MDCTVGRMGKIADSRDILSGIESGLCPWVKDFDLARGNV